MPKPPRELTLEAARRAVMHEQGVLYDPPETNFARIARFWNAYLEGRSEITPYDTAIMMVLVKVARTMSSPEHLDHLVDGAGYFACAADVRPDPDPDPLCNAQGTDHLAVCERSAGHPSSHHGRGRTGDLSVWYCWPDPEPEDISGDASAQEADQ